MKTQFPMPATHARTETRVATRRTSASDSHAVYLMAMLPLGFFLAFDSSPTLADVAGALGLAILVGGFSYLLRGIKQRG